MDVEGQSKGKTEETVGEGGEEVHPWEGGDGGVVVGEPEASIGYGLRHVEDLVHVHLDLSDVRGAGRVTRCIDRHLREEGGQDDQPQAVG